MSRRGVGPDRSCFETTGMRDGRGRNSISRKERHKRNIGGAESHRVPTRTPIIPTEGYTEAQHGLMGCPVTSRMLAGIQTGRSRLNCWQHPVAPGIWKPSPPFAVRTLLNGHTMPARDKCLRAATHVCTEACVEPVSWVWPARRPHSPPRLGSSSLFAIHLCLEKLAIKGRGKICLATRGRSRRRWRLQLVRVENYCSQVWRHGPL